MNTKKRTSTKRRPAKTKGETAEIPRTGNQSPEERATYALERIAGAFERIASAAEEYSSSGSSVAALLESIAGDFIKEIRAGKPRSPLD
jgi:hypothetical protein